MGGALALDGDYKDLHSHVKAIYLLAPILLVIGHILAAGPSILVPGRLLVARPASTPHPPESGQETLFKENAMGHDHDCSCDHQRSKITGQ